MSGYAKLYSSITESSLWCVGSKDARLLFISMLARADAAGIVEASLPGLAKIANLTVQETEAALTELSLPDVYDRSQNAEGRRVLKVDGGWAIVNYQVYRDRRNEDARRDYMRTYMQKYRKSPVNSVNNGKPKLAEAEATAAAEATALTALVEKGEPLALLAECADGLGNEPEEKPEPAFRHTAAMIYSEYPRKVGPNKAMKAISAAMKLKLCRDAATAAGVDDPSDYLMLKTQNYACYVKEHPKKFLFNGDMKFVPHPATWFGQGRYLDEDFCEWEAKNA